MYNTLIKGYAATRPPQPEAAQAMLQRIQQARASTVVSDRVEGSQILCVLPRALLRVGLRPSATTICLVMDAYCELNRVDKVRRAHGIAHALRHALDMAHTPTHSTRRRHQHAGTQSFPSQTCHMPHACVRAQCRASVRR
eukprot:3420386-Pleurochrysis_carterae.AAC.1